MIRFFLIFFLMLNSHVSHSQDSIKCISYNIRLDTSNDGLDQWENRKESVVSFLIDENPDFIGIQEALWNQVHYLSENMPDYDFVGVGRDDGIVAGEAMIILFKKTTFTLKNYNTSWLSETPNIPSRGWDAACNRTLTTAIFNQENGRDIAIFNTHFDHIGEKARSESIQLIQNAISMIPSNVPYVLMGDFNFEPSNPLYKELVTLGRDAYSYAPIRTTIQDGTFNKFRLIGDHTKRIDYIIYDPNNLILQEYNVPNPMTRGLRHSSDHFPIIAKFSKQ